MRFFLIATLLLTTFPLFAKEPLSTNTVSPDTITAGGKTLAEWRKMAGVGTQPDSNSVVLFEQKTPGQTSTLDACRASLDAQLEVILHNLVNLRTVGYKRLIPIQVEAKDPKTGQLLGSKIVELRTDFSQGPLVKTGRPLDLAIEGPGFFTLRDTGTDNKILFTRRGQFSLDKTGTLGLQCGEQFYPLDPKIVVAKQGDPLPLDQIKRQTFADDSSLIHSEEGLFELPEAFSEKNFPGPKPGKVLMGMLEFSNVDQVAELQEWDMAIKLRKDLEGVYSHPRD